MLRATILFLVFIFLLVIATTYDNTALSQGNKTTAILTVRSNVYDDIVWINNNRYGSTRLDIWLPVGLYIVKVEKKGYKPYKEKIELNSDKTIVANLAIMPHQSLEDSASHNSSNIYENNANQSEWLKAKLYGSDNEIAALRKVNIYRNEDTLRVLITNQFQFYCELKLDDKGRPHTLSNCITKGVPQPICIPDTPDSLCARSSGCFQKFPETNPSCFYHWQVKETKIRLNCFSTKTEDICRGTYTLKSSDEDFGSESQMTIAKRRN